CVPRAGRSPDPARPGAGRALSICQDYHGRANPVVSTDMKQKRSGGAAPVAFDRSRKGPLDGVRVLDLSRLVAGNMLSLQLGDLGADVMKVEPPQGDPLREWLDDGKPLFWKTYARNKRAIVLNLRIPDAREALLRLVETADVLIENYRPGTLEEMALGPDVPHARNRGLIIVR